MGPADHCLLPEHRALWSECPSVHWWSVLQKINCLHVKDEFSDFDGLGTQILFVLNALQVQQKKSSIYVKCNSKKCNKEKALSVLCVMFMLAGKSYKEASPQL